MLGLVDWIHGAEWVGVGVFALVFVMATLVCVPAAPLTAIAGFLFGPTCGVLLTSPLGVLSASLAWWVGRFIARPWILHRLEQRPRFAAIDAAVGQNGFRIVFLLRLASVLPFAPLSYALGASRVRRYDFILASWLGLLPGTFLYVYLGSLVNGLSQILGGGLSAAEGIGSFLYWAGGAVVLVALVVIVTVARKAFNEELEGALPAGGRAVSHK